MTKVLENKAVVNFFPTGRSVNHERLQFNRSNCHLMRVVTHIMNYSKRICTNTKVSLNNSILIDKITGQAVGTGVSDSNAEWQSHQSIQDVSGAWYCLDCQKMKV